jgi:hypothetical protein
VVGCSCIAPVIIERMVGEIRLFTSSGTILRDKAYVKRHKGNWPLLRERSGIHPERFTKGP